MDLNLSGDDLIGILGGMGPAATVDFYQKLVASTAAAKDQDHPRVVIWADPTVPDRSLALLGGGQNPTPWLLRGAQKLVAAGATMIAIPCNTAHAFLPQFSEQIDVPIVSMIEATANYIQLNFKVVRRVGIIATSGTIDSRIYHRAVATPDRELITVSPAEQRTLVMPAISRIKSGLSDDITERLLMNAVRVLIDGGAEIIVAGCTEVVLGLSKSWPNVPLLDPAQVLVDELLCRLGYPSSK